MIMDALGLAFGLGYRAWLDQLDARADQHFVANQVRDVPLQRVEKGPFAPDTVFMRARGFAEFDVVVAMYHDQGLIPVKYLGVEQGVNVTLGLPLVRTSPDHGTAFDLAGSGRADAASLLAAVRMARRMAQTKTPVAQGERAS